MAFHWVGGRVGGRVVEMVDKWAWKQVAEMVGAVVDETDFVEAACWAVSSVFVTAASTARGKVVMWADCRAVSKAKRWAG
jgi:hypothetical protein